MSLIQLGGMRLPGAKRTIRQWRYHRGLEPFFIDGVLSYRWSMGALMPYGGILGRWIMHRTQSIFSWAVVVMCEAGRQVDWDLMFVPTIIIDATDVVPIGGTAIGFGSVNSANTSRRIWDLLFLRTLVAYGIHLERLHLLIYNRQWVLVVDMSVPLVLCVLILLVV